MRTRLLEVEEEAKGKGLGQDSMSAGAGHVRANAELSKRQDEMLQLCMSFFGDPLPVDKVQPATIEYTF